MRVFHSPALLFIPLRLSPILRTTTIIFIWGIYFIDVRIDLITDLEFWPGTSLFRADLVFNRADNPRFLLKFEAQ